MKRFLFVVAITLFTLPAAAASVAVNISQFKFNAPEVTVAPGTEVTWINEDDEPHIVAIQGAHPLFRSPALDKGEQYSFVFKDPGTYRYYCTLHPHMVGAVVVVAK